VDDGSGAFPATVKVTVASTASGIVLVLSPQAMQVALPAEVLHDKDLPAAAGPGATVTDEKSVVEYPRVHWVDAGCVPGALRARFSAIVLPGAAVPDDRLSEVLWAKQDRQTAMAAIAMRSVRAGSPC
jgi:hypothetical protein